MKIAIGCDHAGIILKDTVMECVRAMGHEPVYMGCPDANSCDYPIYGRAVAKAVKSGQCDMGILMCGTGCGISLAANRIPGIRCVNCSDVATARLSREHNDANVISIGSRIVGTELACDLIKAFLSTPFSNGPRHIKRIEMIDSLPLE